MKLSNHVSFSFSDFQIFSSQIWSNICLRKVESQLSYFLGLFFPFWLQNENKIFSTRSLLDIILQLWRVSSKKLDRLQNRMKLKTENNLLKIRKIYLLENVNSWLGFNFRRKGSKKCQRSRGKRKKHLADWEILCQHLRTFLLSRYLENVLEERKKTFLHVMHSNWWLHIIV
jgi:hypothetical protein